MTAAQLMFERSRIMLAIRDIDDRLKGLTDEAGSYRVTATVREMLAVRADLADQLQVLNGAPPALPMVL